MNQPANILIVTDGHPCRNPRPVKEASALAHAGYNVTLLYIRNHPPSVAIDDELLANASFKPQSLDFLASDFRRYSRSLCARLASFLAKKAVRFGLEYPSALGPNRLLLSAAQSIPADLTIVHNALPHWVGLQLLRTGRCIAADFEDWNSEDLLPDARRHLPLRLLRRSERDLLTRAAFTTTTSNALADALHARHGGRRPTALTNAFPLQPADNLPRSNSVPGFVWFSQTVGPGRGLEQFLAAWQKTSRPSRVTIIGQPTLGYAEFIKGSVAISHREALEFQPLVSPQMLPELLSRHDIGLALEPSDPPNKNLTISNKILQYLNASLAVVASDTAGQREVLSHAPHAGTIVSTENPTQYTASLDQLISNRSELDNKKAAARQLAESTYCWEHEAPKLVNLVRETLAS